MDNVGVLEFKEVIFDFLKKSGNAIWFDIGF
jgi:hypothetical protein